MAAPTGTVRIGEISYQTKDIIGYGSNHTVVYRGYFGKHNVAVKVFPPYFSEIAEKEKEILLRIEVHSNIVRYYHTEKNTNGYYIALMLCDYTLVEYVKPEAVNLNLTPIKLLSDVTMGLQFLHDSKIIHHDLKPLNILISCPNHTNERKALISDFGISKETQGTRDSVTLTSRRGTDGFVAPEVYDNDTVTNAIDVFALGCIYLYAFSSGEQIFHSKRDVVHEKMYKICIENFLITEQSSDYCSLVLLMIDRVAAKRPTCEQILFHHIYWTQEKKIQFLQVTSDFMERNENERLALDAKSSEISGDSWFEKMSDNIIADLVNGKRNQGKKGTKELVQVNARDLVKKYYDGTKTSSLLRAIRNISNHYDDIIIFAKDEILSSEGFMQSCFEMFPKLFSKIYDMAEEWKINKSIAKFYIQKSNTVGQITFRLEPRIRTTRNGCILYKGQYKRCRVAVKRFNADITVLANNQWNLVQNLRHQNLLRLFCKEERDNCVYIAATLGQYNLFEYVEYYWNNDNPTVLQLLRQITRGLTFLHAKKIVHCNLTPANILISYPNKKKNRIAMIADFELSHNGELTDVSRILEAKLSKEWMAPEWQNSDINSVGEACDIYSLGCIYWYVLSNGKQIIGQLPLISDKRSYVQQLSESGTSAGSGYSELLNQMLESSPKLRPSSSEILQHPIFWEVKRKTKFIKILTDLITVNERAEILLNSIPGNNEQNGELVKLKVHQALAALSIPGLNENVYRNKVENGKELHGKMIYSILLGLNKIGKIKDGTKQKVKHIFHQELVIRNIIYNFPVIVEVCYHAMKELKDPSLQMYYGRKPEMMQECAANCSWTNLDKMILSSILKKVPVKFYKNCHLISKKWHENERIFYTNWIRKNRAKWTGSSFKNAMETNVICKDIYWTSCDKWKMKSTPTLIKQIDIEDHIRHISFSTDGTLLAVCYRNSTKVYSSKNLRVEFSRDIEDRSHSCYFNRRDSYMVLQSSIEMKVIAITVRLPVVLSVACSVPIRSPWLQEKIFLTGKKENDMTTFWLNDVAKSRNADATNLKCLILMVKGNIKCAALIKATDGKNILFYTSGARKLGFKVFSENSMAEIQKKQTNKNIKTPDHEIDCEGTVIDYALSSSVNQKQIHILTEVQQNDYCFLIMDLVTFTTKTSILLVPFDFTVTKRMNFDSNDNFIICWSESNCAYVWEFGSGVCMTQLNNEEACAACAVRPRNNQLVVTVGKRDKKMKFWHLNTYI